MHRRDVLRAAAASGAVPLAGCWGGFGTRSAWNGGPIVEDRPDAVYVPAGIEEMGTVATRELDDGARLSVHYTYPHRFWTVTGDSRTRVEVREGEALHLMTSVWDPGTGVVLPRRPTAALLRDGERVDGIQFWPMLAQRMGYHFGNNAALPGGQIELRVDLDPLAVRGLGAFDGAFDAPTSVAVPLDVTDEDVFALDVERLSEERRGERDAVAPMEMAEPPAGRVPPVDELPGDPLGSARSGDAVVAATLLSDAPAGVDGDGPYLAVSPRTPYNGIALPNCSLVARVDGPGGGGATSDGASGANSEAEGNYAGNGERSGVPLHEAVEERLGHHYGAVLPERPTERVAIEVAAPPQVARHDGYETAFFDLPPVELSVP